jgi:hypothetical protein
MDGIHARIRAFTVAPRRLEWDVSSILHFARSSSSWHHRSYFGTSPFFSGVLQTAGISKDNTIALKFWLSTSCLLNMSRRFFDSDIPQERSFWRHPGHRVQQSFRRCGVARQEHH